VLSKNPGNSVSNMSSSRALRDVTEKYGGKWSHSAVGEVNVVAKMKETGAVIGGEGNGGVIYPESHYGRDALVGVALFLTLLAKREIKCTELKKSLPQYTISKNRVEVDENIDVDRLFELIEKEYKSNIVDRNDGLLIENNIGWVQIRRSNTEPIIRIYSEGRTIADADSLAAEIIKIVKRSTINN
jgi:phosphomannomutase